MRKSVFLGVVVAFSAAVLASAGCDKKDSPTTGNPAPAPTLEPDTGPKPGGPPENVSYDPQMPEIKIDLARFSSALTANDPAVKEWVSKNGKVAEVAGIMGSFSVNQKTGRETFRLKAETDSGHAIGCELMALPDWQQVGPERRLKVVGVLDVKDHGQRGIDIRLNHATITAVSGNKTIPELKAVQIGKEYAADPVAFEKKWKVEDKFYYVTGTLKEVESSFSDGVVVNKFRVAAGPTDLYCHVLNGRGVEVEPPVVGDRVILLLECQGYTPGFAAIAMTGVYAGKAP